MKRTAEKMVIFGDSISTGTHGEGGYEALLCRSLGLESSENYAVGSSGLSTVTPNCGVSLILEEGNVKKDADLILVWHGSNDWYWGSPIGTYKDTGEDTFFGAVNKSVAKIRSTANQALFVWVNPIYRFEKPSEGAKEGKAYETENRLGLTLYDYCCAVEEAGIRHGFPVIDMHRLCGIHEENEDLFLEDRVHPNKAGYERIHRVLDDSLRHLLRISGFDTI